MENDDMNIETYNKFRDLSIPTKEDLARQLTNEELIELCRRKQCRVLMWRWNPVHDYFESFQRKGRLQHHSRRSALKLLAKAVNKHKAHAVYTDEEIQPVLKTEWEQRKKDNIMSLDLWAYDRKQALLKAQKEAAQETALQLLTRSENEESIEPSILQNFDVNTNSLTLSTQSVQILPSQDAPEIEDGNFMNIPNSGPIDYEDFNNRIPLTSTQSQGT